MLFYFLTGLGHQAVIVFFVLSGYLIAGSILSQINRGIFDIKGYAINRISRLYIVLIVALPLTVLLDHIGIYYDNIGLYTGKVQAATLGFSIASRLSFKYFLSSFFMLQTIVLPPLGSNSSLWSLSNEFWYYILFPCVVLSLFFIKGKKRYSLIYLSALILLTLLLPIHIELYFLIWLLGLIPFYINLKKSFYKAFFIVALFVWLLIKKAAHINDFLYDFVLALIVAFCLASFTDYYQLTDKGLLKLNEKLSSFSYSTYLVHFPVIMISLTLINHYVLEAIWIEPGVIGYLIFTVVFLLVVITSYIVATFTEFKTPQFRDFLKRIFSTKKASSASQEAQNHA
nr:peptidoglycan/LPS O-acetylase OafA/YrhL [Mucilaginibacter sp. X4EP1]